MLLSYRYKVPGYLMILAGATLAVLYFAFSFRFEMPVLAVISSYAETKLFATFKTNFADETIMLLFLGGLGLVAFSAERAESELMKLLRAKALLRTVRVTFFFLLFSVLFVYGGGFMVIVILNLFLPLIIYITIFGFMKRGLSPKDHSS